MVGRFSNEFSRLILTIVIGIIIGYVVGLYVTLLISISKVNPVKFFHVAFMPNGQHIKDGLSQNHRLHDSETKIPRVEEILPTSIIESQSDLYLRKLWGNPNEDLTSKPKYLVTFTVGIDMKENIDAAVKKFSNDDFTIMLFHYDEKTSDWDQYEWSKRAIHVSARKQTKWWYAKRFLHPDIVATYDYIFIWDEDLGLEHFDPLKYIDLVKKYRLEISQPGLDPKGPRAAWPMTKKRDGSEIHKDSKEQVSWCEDPHSRECTLFYNFPALFRGNVDKEGMCRDPLLPPCAGFVEIMAPVFSRKAWQCVWHMIQNDLVHGWGLDFSLHRCVKPAHEKIGVVDAQWIIHKSVPTLINQGESSGGVSSKSGIRKRCFKEWKMFVTRFNDAEKAQQKKVGT